MLWPTAVFWTVALTLSRGPSVGLVYALFAAMPFGAFAVVPPELVGGLTLTPAPVVALLLVLRCLGTPDGRRWFVYACRSVEHFVPLLGFWAVAVLTTLFAPILFAGRAEAVSPRDGWAGPGAAAPLAPSPEQLGQLGYVTLSVLVVIAAARLLSREETRRHVLRAMMLGGSLMVLAGLADRLFTGVGTADPLAPLRTAGDALAARSWSGAAGSRPLSGLMADADAFGTLCVMFVATLWFHRRGVRDRWLRTVFVPWLCVLLGIMVWLSMSPLAWTGLLLVALAGATEASWRALRPRVRLGRGRRSRASTGARRFALLSLTGLALFASSGPAYERAAALVGRLVPAGAVASAPGRDALEAASLRSALDTWGVGVGLGGTPAPNAFLALLSGVGVLGTLCYVGFVVATWAWRPSRRRTDGRAWMAAYRWSLPCLVVVAFASGPSADFGPYLALLFGSSVALQRGSRVERLLQSDAAGASARDGERARRGRRRRCGARPASADAATSSPGSPVVEALPSLRRTRARNAPAFAVEFPVALDLGEPPAPRRARAVEPPPVASPAPAAVGDVAARVGVGGVGRRARLTIDARRNADFVTPRADVNRRS